MTKLDAWKGRIKSLLPTHWSERQKRFFKWEMAAVFLAGPIVAVAMNALGERYWIGHDPSDATCLPWHWMLAERVSDPMKRDWKNGDIVVIAASRMAPYVKDGTTLGKFVIATPGDRVDVRADGIFVNGDTTPSGYIHVDAIRRADAHLRTTVAKDALSFPDRPVESFYRTLVVEKGELFLMGVTPRSQDSRYFGPQRIENIRGVVVAPLW
jgi:signal peptidase I